VGTEEEGGEEQGVDRCAVVGGRDGVEGECGEV